MKKKCIRDAIRYGAKTKTWKIMRLSAFFLFLCLSQVWAGTGYSQQTKLTLKMDNARVIDVLYEIEENSEFYFLFNQKLLNIERKVNVDVDEKTIDLVLNELFNGTGVNYKIKDRIILLTTENADLETDVISSQQQRPVYGSVTDESGQPLPGVSVVVKGTTQGTVSDGSGNYSLNNVPDNATLVFSFVGMRTQEIPVANKNQIDIIMAEATIGIEEVVAVGYGTIKKVNLTGSVEVVGGDQLADRPAAQTAQLLQGQSPSTMITMGLRGGEPGHQQAIQIRGVGSITGDSKPLVLVDGVEMDMNIIDPTTIESISILKDASSSAIYGSRAAFGVILIQTKKGSERPVSMSYNNITSLNVPYYTPDMEDSYTYATVFNQARANAGLSPTFGEEQVERIKGYIEGTYPYPYNPDQPPFNHWRGRWDGNANVNWGQEYFRPSVQQKHNFNVEGGNENIQFYTSLGYLDEPGIMRWGNDQYERYNILGNMKVKANDWLNFDFSARYSKVMTDRPNGGVWNDRSGYWMHFNILWPTMPMYNIDGTIHNPIMVALMDGGRIETQDNNSRFAVGTEIEPVKGWKTIVKYNYTTLMGTTTNHKFEVPTHIANGTMGNIGFAQDEIEEELRTGSYMVFTAYSQYEKKIEDHYFSVMAGYEHDYSYHRNLSGDGADLITNEVPSISTALGTKEVDDQIYHWATQAGFGRINYNYKDKYMLELSARYDGSSKFAPGQRWGFFPSGSVGYNISREDFWEPIEHIVQKLKLRVSYGNLGNQTIQGSRIIRSGQSFTEYLDPNVANYLYLEEIPIYQRLGRVLDGARPNYADMPAIASDYLTWEKVNTFDIGIEAGFLRNRLNMEFDWYKRITDDMIGPSVELPSVLGTGAPSTNNAKLETKGFELILGWKDRVGEITYNANISVGDYMTTILDYVNENGDIDSWYAGKKMGDVWGLTTDGLLQTEEDVANMPDQSYYYATWRPGDMRYKDLTDDNKIDPGLRTLEDHGDLTVIANTTPRYQIGISAGLKWKNFDFNMFWQGIGKRLFVPDLMSEYYWGHLRYPNSAILLRNAEYHLDYWRPADETNFLGPNTDAYQPIPYFSSQRNKNLQTQTRYIDNARYMRLKNLQIGYTLPASLLSKTPIRAARIYFSGENLLTLQSLPKAFEPESIISSDTYMRTYPIHQMYSVGLNITF